MTFRSATLLGDNSTSQHSTLGGAFPPGSQAGDKILIVALQSAGANTMTITTTGTTTPTLRRGPDYVNANLTGYMWSLNMAAGDVGKTVTITSSGGGWFVGLIIALSNASSAAPIFTEATDSTAGTSATSGTITTTATNSDVVTFWLVRAAAGTPPVVTAPSGHTKVAESNTADSVSPNYTVAATYLTTPGAAGTYGGDTATFNESVSGAIMYTVGITPNATTADPGLDFFYVDASGLRVQCSLYYVDAGGTLQLVADRTA